MLFAATVAMSVSGDFSWQNGPSSTYENGPAVDNSVGVRAKKNQRKINNLRRSLMM
jgi:hypothetical protein